MKNVSIIETCLIRFALSVAFVVMEGGYIKPFTRTVFKDQSSLYGHFSTESYVPGKYIWWMLVLVPMTIILLFYVFKCVQMCLNHSRMILGLWGKIEKSRFVDLFVILELKTITK